jgi:methylated-DNA-[protein]-cysteine S-methyltransferase
MTSYSILKTSLGELMLVANETALIGLYFRDQRHVPLERKTWRLDETHPILIQAARELREYLEGKRSKFSFVFNPGGTDFQKRVWREISRIPFGKTISYSDLAKKAGKPHAIRAAGTATGRNPICILIPCHRVVGKNGDMGGYAGGLERKQSLLELEKGKNERRSISGQQTAKAAPR